ncbi:MAG: AMP-binding protein [Myxococcales bacterium]|nr:AMP-binding protein [Myxococcales bacterium]MCB9578626.1 AMP-binding protein [Polyangiaceae bacterium]
MSAQLGGRRLVVIGGTGFLGKVFWTFLLSKYPDVGHLYLVVRERDKQNARERFWNEIAKNDCLNALREEHGERFETFLRDKVTPIGGDVVHPFCGLDAPLREDLRGTIDAVVNASGVVDFDPPLDEALEVNAFGVQNLVALAKDLGNVPLLHTSTCFVAGSRTGIIEELDPREFPFPRAHELEQMHWEPDREIAECLDVVEQARHRSSDAFRQSRFLDQAKKNLLDRGEPSSGPTLEKEVERVKRKFVEAQLAEMGMERAQFWGFPNTYTYTKAIGEQIVASSGLAFTIVRPAIVESTSFYPFPGWNEGINTSAPLIYSLREGQTQIPGSDNFLDFIPCDMVAAGMTLSLAELLEGTAPPVYQYGSSDSNPCTMRRFFELSGLYKRKYYKRTGRGGPVLSALQSRFEGAMLDKDQFRRFGPKAISKATRTAASFIERAALGPAAPLLSPTARVLSGFAEQQDKIGDVLGAFVPFTAEYHYVFRCDNTRAAYARVNGADRDKICWQPEQIDWRQWFLEVHVPALEKWVFPKIDERIRRPRKAPERHETLTSMLGEMTERYDLAVALQRTETEGLSRITYREWQRRSLACAGRLAALGVERGDRVMLAGANHPAWPIAFFGIHLAGATVVPLDAGIDASAAANLARASGAKVFIADDKVRKRVRHDVDAARGGGISWLDLWASAESGEPIPKAVESRPDDVAALIYTSGTTGTPKGVMLSHENITALVASLAPLFPLSKGDRVLSVLPLHHTFELTCGMLLPLSRGARVVYLDELTAERLEAGLKSGRITAMIGVPALWEMLERRITAKVAERGSLASHVFDFAVELNRTLGKSLGVDAGKVLFGPVHTGLGGHLRYLVSGGAALPEKTHHLFSGMGLHLAEGYGLTEAAPVLTVAESGPKSKPGHVGKPVPGVEIRIDNPNSEGVGEVLARGPNVMLGYSDDEETTRRVIDSEGWLHTGDLGKLDKKGNLVIVGREKDTIVTSSGENVYPDDVEARIGSVEHVVELAIVGASDGRGGERVACVAVVAKDEGGSRGERHARAKRALDRALSKLPVVQRPSVVTLVDGELPRTATRKVKRREVQRLVERVAPLSERPPSMEATGELDRAARQVRAAVGAITRKDPSKLSPGMSLRGDLGFDSLMLLELLVALEAQVGASLDAERLSSAETIEDAEAFLRELSSGRRPSASASIEREDETPFEIPDELREAAMHWLGRAQMGFYDRVLSTKVTGRAFIPFNRNTLVAANHASHLDMGLVKYALGSYGQDLVSLAAQDYFFEGNRWRKAYFENLTNLVPMSRTGSLRQSLRQAGELLEQGKTVLIFPEGTRSSDGEVQEFKPAVGHLALHYGIDILPVYLGGTHRALPKGASVPRRRDVAARIGPPLTVSDLRRLTAEMSPSEASRAVSSLVRRAVLALSRGEVLDIAQMGSLDAALPQVEDEGLAPVFSELSRRFVAGAVDETVTFYFSLGEKERWTVMVDATECQVTRGKATASADCVLKTTPTLFTRIVREAYTPDPAEFVSGAVKSNNIGLLMTFQKVFQLDRPSAVFAPARQTLDRELGG